MSPEAVNAGFHLQSLSITATDYRVCHFCNRQSTTKPMRPGVQEGLHTSLKDPQQNPDSDWLLKEIYGSVSKLPPVQKRSKGVELGKLTGFSGQKHSPPDRECAPTTPFFQLH